MLSTMVQQRTHAQLVSWLEADEAGSRAHRAARLQKLLATLRLPDEGMLHWGGLSSLHILMELRLTYIHGLFFSSVLLALAFIEKELAGALHASGWDGAAKASLQTLLEKGEDQGVLTSGEASAFNRLRGVRNGYVHYRSFAHPSSDVRRALREGTPLEDLPESDAVDALTAVSAYLARREKLL